MSGRVVVRAPATVANLGPGFDALGLALAWYDEVRIERYDGPLEMTITGRGSGGTVGQPEDSGLVQAIERVAGSTSGLRIHRMASVAFGRGYGASAIAIVAGLVGARALFETSHSDDQLLGLATELEGHPDNVAPCLRGGIAVCANGRVLRFDAPSGLKALVCVSPNRLATIAARAVLPESLWRNEAVANAARAALLAATLATGNMEMLLDATEDTMHQPPRFQLMPESGELLTALRAKGFAAFLSGAGPSVTALVPSDQAEAAERAARALAPEGWEIRLEDIDARGAAVVEQR